MEKNKRCEIPGLIRRGLIGWMAGVAAVYIKIPAEVRGLEGLNGLQEMSFGLLILVAGIVFVGLSAAVHVCNITVQMERWLLFGLFAGVGVVALHASFTVPFLGSLLWIGGILWQYARRGWDDGSSTAAKGQVEQTCSRALNSMSRPKENPISVYVAGGAAVCFFLLISVWTVFRVKTYSAPSFDMGIFSQMFYRMKTTGLPDTTIERDGLLSHFQVHVSPIYYLMLPIYCLWPVPEMLQILQAGVMASAVIPAWKLVRRHGCSHAAGALLCVLLLLYPAYAGGAGYDIHENAFLTPLLLWLFYAMDCKKGWGVAVSAALTLLVKEDAAMYVAVAGLWMLCTGLLHKQDRKWNLCTGILLLAGAISWFAAVTGYLATYGDGVMTYRYKNLMYDDSGSLVTVVKAAILSPMKVLYECVDEEKLYYIAWTMLPLCGLPAATRRYERYILWIPYVLMNLVSDYEYQHSLFFQYSFGSAACLFYLVVVNYRDWSVSAANKLRRYVPLCLAVIISAIGFGTEILPRVVKYPVKYAEQRVQLQEIEALLAEIPEEASVTASTFYTVPLANRQVLYDVQYSSKEHLLSTEYVVLEVDQESSYAKYEVNEGDGYVRLVELLEDKGYEVVGEAEGEVVVYRKKDYGKNDGI